MAKLKMVRDRTTEREELSDRMALMKDRLWGIVSETEALANADTRHV